MDQVSFYASLLQEVALLVNMRLIEQTSFKPFVNPNLSSIQGNI